MLTHISSNVCPQRQTEPILVGPDEPCTNYNATMSVLITRSLFGIPTVIGRFEGVFKSSYTCTPKTGYTCRPAYLLGCNLQFVIRGRPRMAMRDARMHEPNPTLITRQLIEFRPARNTLIHACFFMAVTQNRESVLSIPSVNSSLRKRHYAQGNYHQTLLSQLTIVPNVRYKS